MKLEDAQPANMAKVEIPDTPHTTTTSSFKLAKEVKDFSSNDIGFDSNDDESTTVLTANSKVKSGPVIIRTRTGERIRIDKPIFCIG